MTNSEIVILFYFKTLILKIMATLKGPIQITGSFGTFRCYFDKARNQYTIATKGGQNRNLVRNSPKLKRQRENMNEFKVCSQWASLLQKSLLSIEHLHWGYYFPKITALGRAIIDYDYDDFSKKGFRSLESSKAAKLLKTINFNKLHPFDEVLRLQNEVLFSEDKKTVTLKIPGLLSFKHIKWPERYASYRITLVIVQLPDWKWSKKDKKYKPVLEDSRNFTVITYSKWLTRSTESVDIILEASFTQPALQQPGTTVVVAMGIEFSKTLVEPNTIETYGIGTMKIVECFV
jgi:hypothetical protein